MVPVWLDRLTAIGWRVLAVSALGIVITHKVVGPVFKLKRLLREVGNGALSVHERLRKGDELSDLFDTFLAMVDSLRRSQEAELDRLRARVEPLVPANPPGNP